MPKVIDDVLGGRLRSRGGKVSLSGSRSAAATRRSPLKTVVKGRYRTLSSKGPNPARGRASGVMRNIDYMTTRPDSSRQRISRDMILPDRTINLQSDPESRKAIEDELTNAKEKYIYHLILSSGDKTMSPRDVELWAKAVLQAQGLDKYYMVVHAGEQGHTSHPHAHVIVRTDARLGKEDFFNMRRAGDVEQRFDRRLFRLLEEDWKQKSTEKSASSGGGLREVDADEEERGKRRGIDIQLD